MNSKEESSDQKSSDEEYSESVKKPSKESKKGNENKKNNKKAAKKSKPKDVSEEKDAKKKKASKSKDKGSNMEKDLEIVREYMEKQNRPYSLINVYDNLHASIKKPALETILDTLTESEHLTCKEFGKNKVYFLNQSKFTIDAAEIETVSEKLTKIRQESAETQSTYKSIQEEHKKLFSIRTFEQMYSEQKELNTIIEKLENKKSELIGETSTKIEEHLVEEAEKQKEKLKKELKKYKNIVKNSIDSWAEALEKKKPEIIEIIGLDM